MRKWLLIGWSLVFVILGWLYWSGVNRSFFHQDDIVYLSDTVSRWPQILWIGVNEHLIILFRIIFRWEWLVFGVNFGGFLLVSILLHLYNLLMIFVLVRRFSQSNYWAMMAVWWLVINNNWNEIVWWSTGQMMMLSTLLGLISWWWLKKSENKFRNQLFLFILSILPGLAWGSGIAWPFFLFLIYGWEKKSRLQINSKGWTLIGAQLCLAAGYLLFVRKNKPLFGWETWLHAPLKIVSFMAVGIGNTVIGRWLWPLENKPVRILVMIGVLLFVYLSKWWRKFRLSKEVMFCGLVMVGTYFLYALPRYGFGIGQAMATRYAYQPTVFWVIAISILLSRIKVNKAIFSGVVFLMLILSFVGFEQRVSKWVERPQQEKVWLEKLNSIRKGECIVDSFWPEYVVDVPRWKTSEIWPVFKKGFSPFGMGVGCLEIN